METAGSGDHFGESSAAAALGGLLFVAVSINLQRILSLPRIPARAALSLVLLATPVFFGVVILIPDQPRWALGGELIVIAAVIGPLLGRLADPCTESPSSRCGPG